MLIKQGDKTIVGPADIVCILKLPSGRFHAAIFVESPMPGPIEPIEKLDFLRLKSQGHHTIGAETLEGAQVHITEWREKLIIDDKNVVSDVAIEVYAPENVWITENWLKTGRALKEALMSRPQMELRFE